jgi:hypothetical protein
MSLLTDPVSVIYSETAVTLILIYRWNGESLGKLM